MNTTTNQTQVNDNIYTQSTSSNSNRAALATETSSNIVIRIPSSNIQLGNTVPDFEMNVTSYTHQCDLIIHLGQTVCE